MITRIDHLAISAPHYEAARDQYTCVLGQPPVAESGLAGGRAALFALCNTRVLLLEAATQHDEVPHIAALGLGTPDAHSCSATLQAQGVAARALHDLPSALAATEAWELPADKTRGLRLRIVARPETVLPAAVSFSSQQVEALDHVVIRSAAPEQAIALYGGVLGMRLALDRELAGTRMLFFRTGGVTVEVIEQRHAEGQADDSFYGVAYRVRDLHAAHLRLTAAGIPLTDIRSGRKAGTHVFSTRAHAGIVPTLFIRDASRD
jgi:catechol 2,3-dioxygenase-like lactoylglutathione lyase family enzyme